MRRTTARSRGTTGARHGASRGGRAALAGGLALAVAAGAGGAVAMGVGDVRPQATDAAWASQEAGALRASAGIVAPASTTCPRPQAGQPHALTLRPGDGGLEVTGYRVTVALGDGDDNDDPPADDDVPDGKWQSSPEPGLPPIEANTPTIVPVGTDPAVPVRVAWGIEKTSPYTWKGTATVTALGPGGWESDPVVYDWQIGFDFLGIAYPRCEPRPAGQ